MKQPMSINEYFGNRDIFEGIYDTVRIVDPLNKRVLKQESNSLSKTDEKCFGYWENGHICDNCISMRAYRNNKTYIKIEKLKNKLIHVMAIPIIKDDEVVVLELLKVMYHDIIIGEGQYNIGQSLLSKFDEIDNLIVRDNMTPLYNRRFIDERLPSDIILASVDNTNITVLFIDIDDIKYINDTYGHQAGDNAIKCVGEVLDSSIRKKQDWAARYGGDEFVVCLNNTDEKTRQDIIKHIYSEVNKTPIRTDKGEVFVSISIGEYTMEEEKLTAEEILSIADTRMYEMKNKNKEKLESKL